MANDLVTTPLELDDTWAYGKGTLHGGWLLETLTAHALQHTAHPHPLAVSGHYAAAPHLGTAELTVEALREGRSVASLRTALSQQGRTKLSALVTAGTLPAAASRPLLVDGAAPVLPAPERCPRHEAPPDQPRNGITEQLEVRLDPASAPWLDGAPGGRPLVAGWVRSATGRPVDPLLLLSVLDALPPVTPGLGIAGWVPTIELTAYLRCQPVDGWLAVVQRARLLHGGWLEEDCDVWDAAGNLVAQSRQLAGYREPVRSSGDPSRAAAPQPPA